MKTVLKFSGIISCVLAIVGFILLLATAGVKYTSTVLGYEKVYTASGVACIFGGTNADYSATWAGLLAFILVVVALVILIAAIVLPLAKVNALDKFSGILNIVATLSLIVAGIFTFCIVGAFKAANGALLEGSSELASAKYSIGAGWVIAGILFICAGVFAIAPAVADFVSKKK